MIRRLLSKKPNRYTITDATNAVIIETPANTTDVSGAGSLWQTALRQHVSRLPLEDQLAITSTDGSSIINQHSLGKIFEPIRTKYSQSFFFKCLHAVNPIVNHMRSFAVVVDVLTQTSPNPTSLIWGAIRLLLEVCPESNPHNDEHNFKVMAHISSRSFQIVNDISRMLVELSSTLPLFEQWLRLFPTAHFAELSDAITQTFLGYLSFLVDAILYFRRSAFLNTLHMTVSSSLKEKFQGYEQAIKATTERVVLELHTASSKAAERRHRELRDILTSSANSPPYTEVEPKLPYYFLQNVLRNDRFFGRQSTLDEVTDTLTPGSNRTRSIAIIGLGGIGKTQVAIEYVYRNIGRYKIIIWLHADSGESLEGQFTSIARSVGFATTNDNANYCRDAVLHWLRHTPVEWLLVFDAADNASMIAPFWPAASHGCILVTSRGLQAKCEDLISRWIQLEPFSPIEGDSFLISILGHSGLSDGEERNNISEVAKIFDGLPLGLKVVGSFMKSKRITAKKFLTLYAGRLTELERSSPLESIWDISLESISSEAAACLDVLVLFDGDAIPVEILFKGKLLPPEKEIELHDAIESLSQNSLITVADSFDYISIQKYFQDSMIRRIRMQRDRYMTAFSIAVDSLCKILPPISKAYIGRNPKNWPAFEKFMPHLQSLTKNIPPDLPQEASGLGVDLLCRFGSFFYETGQYHLGFENIQLSIQIATNASNIDPRTLAYAHYIYGYLNLESNKPSISEKSLSDALGLLGDALGNNQLEIRDRLFLIAIRSLLGNSLTGQGKFCEAEETLKLAIELSEAGGEETSGSLGTLYSNLGSCLLWKGDLESAEAVLHRSLLKHRRGLNCNLYALGNVYLRLHRLEEAYQMHIEALESFSRDFGHRHHATADACHKVGSILALDEFPKKDMVESERYLRKALEIYECSMNEGCLDMGASIARTRWKLASILKLVQGSDHEEIQRLEQMSTTYVVETLKLNPPADSHEMEGFYDSLVFFWSR
ncbi:uncharacterized protein F4822DRAFT_445757 [Hypoxylon trugodes]|uniref:uncharacterized protein n=1 Tax=Hypoxylon trugodes TaxID=326681 RepID=UPI00219B56A0|nr:uncharacterized protein F4822DRAFT_445757 [Hypoxylon trugodes]KAI1385930.1 hypothetical protein F4822DRAFT_445757 [Hypoxylon trugodes]